MGWNEFIETSYSDLSKLNRGMPPDVFKEIAEKYPIRIPEYYLSLVQTHCEDDPIGRMCLPSLDEFSDDGSFDTSGESDNTVLKGLQHKYKQTVLILSTNQCAMYCRFCFRRRIVGIEEDSEVISDFNQVMDYIAAHKEISNVLISGGDSFMLNNGQIQAYLESLCKLSHIDYIRFGTKIPVVLPQRISEDEELLGIFKRYSQWKQIYVITQYNHSRELTEESICAIKKLQGAGIIVKNQTVLLKGVNDDPRVLGTLLKDLTSAGIIPYYVFQCRPVRGITNQFQVPIKRGIAVVEQAKAMQNGNGKCFRYILSNHQGKIEIVGQLDKNTALFKYHQTKVEENYGKLFTRQLTDDACWID